MDGTDVETLLERFCDRSLPAAAWTHEAHLTVCWAALRTRTAAETLDFLREAIRSYNEATSGVNTATSGYHETITRYFVTTVDRLDVASAAELLGDEACDRSAPLRHWSRDLLSSPEARAGWVEPDLEPLRRRAAAPVTHRRPSRAAAADAAAGPAPP